MIYLGINIEKISSSRLINLTINGYCPCSNYFIQLALF